MMLPCLTIVIGIDGAAVSTVDAGKVDTNNDLIDTPPSGVKYFSIHNSNSFPELLNSDVARAHAKTNNKTNVMVRDRFCCPSNTTPLSISSITDDSESKSSLYALA